VVLEIAKMLQNIKRYIHTWPILSVELTVNYLSIYTHYFVLFIYIYIYIRYRYIHILYITYVYIVDGR